MREIGATEPRPASLMSVFLGERIEREQILSRTLREVSRERVPSPTEKTPPRGGNPLN
jgi:hypothetical protein